MDNKERPLLEDFLVPELDDSDQPKLAQTDESPLADALIPAHHEPVKEDPSYSEKLAEEMREDIESPLEEALTPGLHHEDEILYEESDMPIMERAVIPPHLHKEK